ncbi:hypothetical protein [uncultured Dysosmobacter sp.]|uniref:hypothetical protein n=1 Tax=uncultured Dysosmobacter sp. TaxID=2591384 RepID=UPI00261FA3E1|nr:hypothetical protein [uncultured Dysosmobacter sp.]
MDKFPLLWDGKALGELTIEREALYTWFSARCQLPRAGLWCAWVVGDRGELRLGLLEPDGRQASIRRRFSGQMTAPLGRVLRGELRLAGGRPEAERWEAAPKPEELFRAGWLRQRLRGREGALTRTARGCRYLALPYDKGKPFPITTLFCFARIKCIRGEAYAVFAFDDRETPVFW